ncbi:Conserved_hypothetical protein [Hexamita inflata]|uniref:Transposase n=1 Tax=Hexamita inflata TaxID=28002 RepID=A0ABP1JTY0_9EUKA
MCIEYKRCRIRTYNKGGYGEIMAHIISQHNVSLSELWSRIPTEMQSFKFKPIQRESEYSKWLYGLIIHTVEKFQSFRSVESQGFQAMSKFSISSTSLRDEVLKMGAEIESSQFDIYNGKQIYATIIYDGFKTQGGQHIVAFMLKTYLKIHFVGSVTTTGSQDGIWLAKELKKKIQHLEQKYQFQIICVFTCKLQNLCQKQYWKLRLMKLIIQGGRTQFVNQKILQKQYLMSVQLLCQISLEEREDKYMTTHNKISNFFEQIDPLNEEARSQTETERFAALKNSCKEMDRKFEMHYLDNYDEIYRELNTPSLINNAHNYLRTSVNGKEDKLAYLKAVWRNNEHMHSIFSVFETLTVSNGSVERLFSFYHRQTSHFLRRNLDYLTLDAMAYIYVEKIANNINHKYSDEDGEQFE